MTVSKDQKPNHTQIAAWLPNTLHDSLVQYCKMTGQSKTTAIRVALINLLMADK